MLVNAFSILCCQPIAGGLQYANNPGQCPIIYWRYLKGLAYLAVSVGEN